MRKVAIAAGVAALMAAGSAAAQDLQPAGPMLRKQQVEGQLMMARVPLEKTTTGAPYSAQTSTESSQVLADGNRIARKTTGRIYRDTEGRVRREEDRADGTVAISIVDPVSGYAYRLDPGAHVAWRTPAQVAGGVMARAAVAPAEARARAKMEREMAEQARARGGGVFAVTPDARGGMLMRTPSNDASLERKVIDGIPVEGHSTTTTIPAGQIGNERPITIVNEEWSSPDLKVLVMTRHSDPRTGDSLYRLTNITRGEPDPSLFVVPAGYEVRDTGIRRDQK
jgi:hypothetical protein